ncbi:MAG TPA: hypothetical protein VD772_10430, partial [Anseongella sp.]|nr:hypothetical protein [Anseongella sp.]
MDYFIKVNLAVALFYGFYQLALKQSVYFTANRVYLLSGLAFSFILPAFRFPGGHYLAEIKGLSPERGPVSLDPVLVNAERSVLPSPSLF